MIEQVLLIDTLTMNPFIGIQIAAIMQTIYMVFLAYSHFIGTNQLNLKRERENPIIILIKFVYLMLNIIFRALFGLLSVLLVDFSAGWLLGAWDYTDWKYQLPSAILSLIIGIQYIYKVYIKPYEFKSGILMEKNYKNENSDSQSDKNNAKRSQSLLNIKSEGLCLTLKVKDSIIRIDLINSIIFIGTLIEIIIFIHVWVPSDAVMGKKMKDNILLLAIFPLIIYFLVNFIRVLVLLFIHLKAIRKPKDNHLATAEDASEKTEGSLGHNSDVNKVKEKKNPDDNYSITDNEAFKILKINLVFWILIVSQAFLSYLGYSLLEW